MSRSFQFKRPTLVCDGSRCLSKTTFASAELPVEPTSSARIYWNAEWRQDYDAAVFAAFKLLEAEPTPKGWVKLINGGELLTREVGYDSDDPEFCSLRCLRLWVAARERYQSQEGAT